MPDPTPSLPELPAEPVITPRPRFFSVVWLVPLAAILVGLWLAYTSYRDRGPEILLRFKTGSGILAGKTLIKFRGVTVGMVKKVELDLPSGEVSVTARMTRDAADFTREDTLFWMVTPRISLKEASGLDTLLAGQYITLRPGTGKPQYRFKALDAPPAGGMDAPGLHLVLMVEELGALTAGSPVLHRDVPVGQITHYDPPGAGGAIHVHLNIEEAHASLVRKATRFWNASGMSLDADLTGVRFKLESISTLIEGGIAFDLPSGEPDGDPAANGDVFTLFVDRELAIEAGERITLRCANPEGLRIGTPVTWRGANAGRVVSVRLLENLAGAEVQVMLRQEAGALARTGSIFWVSRPTLTAAGREGLSSVLRGPRIEAAAGPGQATNQFVCAETAPAYRPDEPGLHIRLLAPAALPPETPIRHRGLTVGRVQGSELDNQTGWLIVHTTIEPVFAKQLTASAAFWMEDGLSVDANWNGVRAHLPSLTSLLDRAIGVEWQAGGKPADEGMLFPLHENRTTARPDGIELHLRMKDTQGMMAGAPVNYRGVEIGRVTRLVPDLSDPDYPVGAILRLDRKAAPFARTDSRYFMVEPRLDLGGSSNLFAFITGPWLEARPGEGDEAAKLTLSNSESTHTDSGKMVRLRSPRATSIDRGAPIFFMGMEAGEVTSRQLEPDGSAVILEARIWPKMANHVHVFSRFYEREGVKVSGGMRGLQIETGSLATLIRGGIAFINLDSAPEEAAAANHEFQLYPGEVSAREGGMTIRVSLPDARGLSRGSEARHQGVAIGRVEEVRLNTDLRTAEASVRLFDGLEIFASEGARWWPVSAEISIRGVRDADTLIGGPYLNAEPGTGKLLDRLAGENQPPLPEGLDLVLRTTRAASLTPGIPVLYRDLPVGRVNQVKLSPAGDGVLVQIRITSRFVPLVTAQTKFWNAGGFGLNVGLFGAKVRSSTLESLFSGAISFATPAAGPAPATGTEFPLLGEPEEDWLKWAPTLPVSP